MPLNAWWLACLCGLCSASGTFTARHGAALLQQLLQHLLSLLTADRWTAISVRCEQICLKARFVI